MSQSPPFRILGSRRPFQGKVVTVRTDRIADDEGRTGEREVFEHNGAVAALVVDDDGRVVLVDQWRHAVGSRLLEIAAGKYDVDGEAVEDALRRELAEELGVEGGAPAADWEEQGIEVARLPFEEALRRAAGPPGDAKTLVALGLYGLKLAGSWAPDPEDRPPPDAPARRAAARPG